MVDRNMSTIEDNIKKNRKEDNGRGVDNTKGGQQVEDNKYIHQA